MSGLMERVVGAPITWGVCEVPRWGYQLTPKRVLGDMTRIGLRATELGPEGYLPSDPTRLRRVLASHGLRLVGGFVPAVLHDERELAAQLSRVRASARLLADSGAGMLVLAVATADAGYEGAAELDADAWRALGRGIERVAELGVELGLTVALHPHYGTVVEGRHHVERLMETSPVPLCLDTGHLVVGGADPVELARTARHRVAHVHLKDVSVDLAEQVRSGRIGYREAVARGMYRPLGAGDVDIAGIVRVLERSGYGGWYVLEQDTVLETAPEVGAGPMENAAASLSFLERVAGEVGIEATG